MLLRLVLLRLISYLISHLMSYLALMRCAPHLSLAVMHGGMPPLSRSDYPEYCSHRRECFPNWHRPYMLEFEKVMRKADVALGRDGNIGLPYWDWSQSEVC